MPPAASLDDLGSVGFDALQVVRRAVTPERVQLRDFRALEAIALADLQVVQVGAVGRNLVPLWQWRPASSSVGNTCIVPSLGCVASGSASLPPGLEIIRANTSTADMASAATPLRMQV